MFKVLDFTYSFTAFRFPPGMIYRHIANAAKRANSILTCESTQ